MRIAIITPFYRQATRGNAVTVRRIECHLGRIGCNTAVFSLDTVAPESLAESVRRFSPDILHAFHGIRCGAVVAHIAKELHLPYLITLTGTELYRGGEQNFTTAERVPLEDAAALVAFHEVIGARVSRALPEVTERVKIIPQGVEVPDSVAPEALPGSPFNFILPAGIRPVKNNLYGFKPLERLWRSYPQIRLLLAGPVLDASYAETVFTALAGCPFASWRGDVPHAAMPSLYRSAHVVLNTSLSEGGMANSILEGMAYGRSVLVSAVEGNSSLVIDGVNGFLYSSEEEFIDKAQRLLLDEKLRKNFAEAGRAYVLTNCSAGKEAASYRELYMNILKTNRGG